MIVAAAIKQDDIVYALPAPARHHDVIAHMIGKGVEPPVRGNQGFIDHEIGFVDRFEGCQIAVIAGQIKEPQWPPQLYSEDLW